MGECCVGSRCEPSDRETCEEIGGHYREEPETCFGLRALTNYLATTSNGDPVTLLAAGGTYDGLYDIRDVILVNSRFGRELLEHYRRHSESVVKAIRSDEKLLWEVLRAFLVAAAFGRAVLTVHDKRDHSGVGDRRLTEASFTRGLAALRRVQEGMEGDSLEVVVAFCENEIGKFVGMSAREVYLALVEDR